jgi:shikimate kinase
MTITLIGFRGSGKSSVASELAARLGWDWADADAEIERQTGASIPEIFADEGEPAFRRYEATVLTELLTRDRLVIAAGGGAVLNEDIRRRMRTAGPVVWLQASLETILSRIGGDLRNGLRGGGSRPPLTSHDPETEAELLLRQREPVYREAATISVGTDGRSVRSVVDEIVQGLAAQPEERA